MYSPQLTAHLLTADTFEQAALLRVGWLAEGAIGNVLARGGMIFGEAAIPLYRVYNPALQVHLLTIDENELSVLKQRGWSVDGIIGYIGSAALRPSPNVLMPLFRLYSPNLRRHLFTNDANEAAVLVSSGRWQNEGVIGYILK
jgi:Repeat of unknown function (DUF5648)